MATRLSETTAARPVVNPAQMLNDQRQILRRILHKTYDIADYEIAQEQSREQYMNSVRSRRPRQVFFIDGARGAGKTSLLLTIRECLGQLGRRATEQDYKREPYAEQVQSILQSFEAWISSEAKRALNANLEFKFTRPHSNARGKSRRTACLLDILFPSDLEGGQPVMEGIFAFMARKLGEEVEALGGKKATDRERVREAEALINRIHDEVSRGWYLSKREGADAIVRDSADYVDYLRKMGQASIASYGRVHIFRDFIYDYLEHFESEMLVVFFDDTDVSQTLTRDILHTIRVFLDHPRIVTVLAGHLKSMRESLLWDAMTELKSPIEAEREGPGSNADTWREFQHHQVEEYLEKVLPRQYRYLIRVERLNELGGPREEPEEKKGERDEAGAETGGAPANAAQADFIAIMGMPFDRYCASMQDRMLSEFTIAKMQAYQRAFAGRVGAADDRELSSLENWIAWWLFRHRYAEQLKPRSVRLKVTMRALFSPESETPAYSERLPSEFQKRLAVFLFESPLNHELIQRFSDADARVLKWLHRQRISSQWRGDRYFEVNGRRIFESSYSYSFICFRVDLGIGTPIREQADERLPPGLLGTPAGPNLIADRPFFPRLRRQRAHGVAAEMMHSVIPANCIYMSDLGCLPDVAWLQSSEQSDPWGSQLIYHWPKLFFYEFDDWRADAKGALERSADDERIKRYLLEVVIPLASIEIGRFVASKLEARGALSFDTVDKAEGQSLLKMERGTPELFEELKTITNLRRRFDYLESVGNTPYGVSGTEQLARRVLTSWKKVIDLALPVSEQDRNDGAGAETPEEKLATAIQSHLRSYRWIINDMRKAFHTGRIFLNDVADTNRRESEGETDTPRLTRQDFFSRSDRYAIPTIDWIDRWLNEHSGIRQKFGGVWDRGWEKFRRYATFEDRKNSFDIQTEDLASGLDEDGRQWDADRDAGRRLSKLVGGAGKLTSEHLREFCQDRELGLILKLCNSRYGKKEFVDAADQARLARAYFLFLFGIVSCLPALVHLDVGSIEHLSRTKSLDAKSASAAAVAQLDKWADLVANFWHFAATIET